MVVDFVCDVCKDGVKVVMDNCVMWNEMCMNFMDLGDLFVVVLIYLVNGVMFVGNWIVLFKFGEKVCLCCINGFGNIFYDVCILGFKLKVVQVDGVDIDLVSVDEFCFGLGEICDVVVELKEDVYIVFVQLMECIGYV